MTDLTPLSDALLKLIELPWQDLGSHLTCSEAEDAFEALTALGRPAEARALMIDHAEADGDEPEDEHYITDTYEEGLEWHRRDDPPKVGTCRKDADPHTRRDDCVDWSAIL